MRVKETYKSASEKITALKSYLTAEENSQMFLYNYGHSERVQKLIKKLEQAKETCSDLNQFEVAIFLDAEDEKILSVLNK